jgi:pimeloyl-ACP methyl ester carboxylesterase
MDPELEKRKWYNYLAKFPLVKWSISKDWANSNDEIFPHKRELVELAEMLTNLDTPTIVIQGMEDQLVPPGNADYVERMMSGADRLEIWRIEGLNHFVPWRRPDLINKAIGELL